MHLILWQYDVRPDQVARFLALYGPAGAWATLFRRTTDYMGTELFRDTSQPTRFLTVDRWTSYDAYEKFRAMVRSEYERLDRECETLTEAERRLGAFDA